MRAVFLGSILVGSALAGAAQGAVAAAVLRAEQDRVAVMAQAKNAVLAIFSADGSGGGSGVVIAPDGYAVTNFHVARPSGNAMKCGMADGHLYDAVIVGLDPTGDVALIKLLGRDDFPAATMADSDQVQPGDWVFAMGNPFLLATDFQPTVTYGIVSGVHRYQYPSGTLLEYTDCLQTDASINPGNSGGPLFDAQGRLIGINGRASFQKRGRVNVGVGYAISINQVKNFLGVLRSGRIVDHATLGARAGFDGEGRVIVTDILDHCDAYRRGLRYGDEIISFGGRAIETPNAFENVLGIFPKGWRVPLSFRHDGKRRDVLVRLQGLHPEEELIDKVAQETPQPRPAPKRKSPKGQPKRGSPRNPKPGEQPEIEDVHRQAPMPEIAEKYFQAKRGYANYFFNKLNRDRVWKAWTGRGDFAGLAGPWTISGRVAGGNPFTLRLSAGEVLLKLPATEWKWTPADAAEASLTPPGSGGLLLALHLWRRLATEGPDRFGDVSYAGTAPLPGCEGLVDVITALHAGVECRFMFHPVEGYLLALEMFPADDADPCEISFRDYHEVDGRWLPRAMEVRLGDELFGAFQCESFHFEKHL